MSLRCVHCDHFNRFSFYTEKINTDNKMIIDWPQTIINDRFFCIQFRNALDYSAVAIFGNLKKSGYNRCCITLLGYHFLSIFINHSTHKNDLTNAFELITVAGRLVFSSLYWMMKNTTKDDNKRTCSHKHTHSCSPIFD